MTIAECLEQQIDFTETERAIADFFIRHRDEIRSIKLGTVAKETFSSNASVIRLCRKLGCTGYKDFQIAYIAELEKQRTKKRDINFNYPFSEHDRIGDIMKNTALLQQEATDICYESVSREALIRAAEWISHASHLYIYGIGDSYISALSFANQLTKLGIVSVMPMQFNESAAISATATKDDVALIVSYSGKMMSQLSKEIRLLKRKKCRIILISALTESPNADLIISVPKKEENVGKISVFYSEFSFQYILACLYGAIYSLDYRKNTESKRNLERYL